MDTLTEDKLFARYKELCAERDATYSKTAPLEKKLEEINTQAQALLKSGREIAAQIDEHLDAAHFARKKEIAFLARALGRPGGLLAKKD